MSLWWVLPAAVILVLALYPRSAKPARTSYVYCPRCRHDLNGDDESFVLEVDGIVTYRCANCTHNSQFDFCHYPVPVCIEGRLDE